MLVFSFVYAMHVLISIWSGSTVFGLLAACLIWGGSVLTEWTEDIVYQFAYTVPQAGMKPDWIDGGIEEVEPPGKRGGVHGRTAQVPRFSPGPVTEDPCGGRSNEKSDQR